jgi:Flp pilus assembly pilin Flp
MLCRSVADYSHRSIRSETASSIIEYLIILAFMSLSAVVTIGQVGQTLKDSIAAADREIQGAGSIHRCGQWGQPPC